MGGRRVDLRGAPFGLRPCRGRKLSVMILANCYMIYLARVPRFRLLAPLRGSTPRQFFILSLDFQYLCRSAQNDTAGGFLREWYNINPLK